MNVLGGATQLALRILGLATSVVVVAVLARYLGPAEYAALAAGLTVVTLLYALTDSGLYPLSVARMVKTSNHLAIARKVAQARISILILVGPLILGVLLLLGAPYWTVIFICALGAIPYAAVSYRAVIESRGRVSLLGLTIVTQNFAWLVLALCAVALELDLIEIAWLSVVAVGVQAITAYTIGRHVAPPTDYQWHEQPTVVELLREAFPLMISALFVTAYYRGSQLLVFSFSGSELAASYLASFRLLDAAQVLPATLVSIYFPLVVARIGAKKFETSLIVKFLWLAALGSTSISLLVILAAPTIMNILLGEQFPSAGMVTRVAFIALPLISLAYILTATLIAFSARRLVAIISSVVACLGFIVFAVLLSRFGVMAALFAFVVTELIHVILLATAVVVVYRKGGKISVS